MRLLLRCDGSTAIGHGHLARAVALGQAARRREHQVSFAVRPDRVASAFPRRFGFEVRDAHDALEWLTPGTDWVVLDGYAFDGALVRAIRAEGARVCQVDDLGEVLPADLVVNPNLFAPPRPGPGFLYGAGFALLREEFAQLRAAQPARPKGPPRLLVIFGGSDPLGMTRRVLAAISNAKDLAAIVAVVGGSHPDLEGVRAVARESAVPVTLLQSSDEIATLMAGSHAAISAAGTTALELMCLGVPSILYAVAQNQAQLGPAGAALGACVDLGQARDFDAKRLREALTRILEPDQAARSGAAGQAAVDGLGAQRVVEAMEAANGR